MKPGLAAVTADAHIVLRRLRVERGGRPLVDGLTLTVARGSFVAVVGPSGAGKTSLLHCLAGLLPPAAGEVRYTGAAGALRDPALLRGRLGLVFQDLRLVPTLSLTDNVVLGRVGRWPWWATLLGLPGSACPEARALLGALGLGALADRWALEASGGEQQRAALARALFLEPEAILADEPVSAVDAEGAVRTLEVLRAEARRLGATVVCVLHDRHLVDRFADFVLTVDPRLERGFRLDAGAPASPSRSQECRA